MANYYATARSNSFRVKDVAAITDELAPFDIHVAVDERQPDRVILISRAEGGWTTVGFDETNEEIELDLPAVVAEHLVDGDVAVLMECGSEKLRYLTGYATAVNAAGETKQITLDDIYELADTLGSSVERI